MDSEIKRFIIKEIERRMNIITSGTAGETTNTSESIDNLYAGMPSIPDRPISQPYGFVSRAKRGTISVTAQQGSHPGNKVTLGHRDPNAPAVAEGESAQYSMGGYTIKCFNDKIQIGKGSTFETAVVGETMVTLLAALIDAIVAHTHLGNLGAPTGPPQNAAAFNTIKSDQVSNGKFLAKDGGRF